MARGKLEPKMIEMQIKPGEVRNPKGKPKGVLNMETILRIVGEEEITLHDGRKLPADTLVIKKLYEAAVKHGDVRAIKTLLEYKLGRPHQRLTIEGNEERPLNVEISNDYLNKLQAALKEYKEKE